MWQMNTKCFPCRIASSMDERCCNTLGKRTCGQVHQKQLEPTGEATLKRHLLPRFNFYSHFAFDFVCVMALKTKIYCEIRHSG